MLFSLKRLIARGRTDPAQLALPLDSGLRTADDLLAHLRKLGLRDIERCQLTRNRNVMVSFRARELRVHEGFLHAPPVVHQAIATFVSGRTRAERKAAQRVIVSHPVRTGAEAPSRREGMRPADEGIAQRLAASHAALNAEHFGGTLKTIRIRVSRRMRSRLGHYTAASRGQGGEIAISWRHLRRHGWDEAVHTLLHEMVHQWQDESGHPIDHGPGFRRKARDVGVVPSARRALRAHGPDLGGRESAPRG